MALPLFPARRCAPWAIPALVLITAAAHKADAQSMHHAAAINPGVARATHPSRNLAAYANLPLSFEPNQGQANPDVRFLAHGQGYSLALTSTEARFALRPPTRRPPSGPALRPPSMLTMRLVGASGRAGVAGQAPLPGKVNYLAGSAPKAWRTNIPTFSKVKYAGVYPGVDLIYYGNQTQLEYDFVVAPRANPAQIGLHFGGASHVTIEKGGDLTVGLAGGSVRWRRPAIYQELNGKRKSIDGRFVLKGSGNVGFALARYDTSRPLVIDPVLAYSTFLGGSSVETATGLALDHDGYAYVTGTTASTDFPGAASPGGGTIGFVAKLDPTGTVLVYSALLGAAFGQAIAIDGAGSACIAGSTAVADLPIVGGAQSAFGGGSFDGFFMKLNPAGTGILYSTFLGGSGTDAAQGIALGTSGIAYVTGYTTSTNFPTAHPFQAANAGNTDAFVAVINPSVTGAASLLYSTYLGGAQDDTATAIAVDSSGRFFVTGDTTSADFPVASAFQSQFSGFRDAFVSAFRSDGSGLSYSSYLGGSVSQTATGIAVDSSVHAFITGYTFSTDFPVRNAIQNTYGGGNTDAIVAEFDCGATGDASLVYSTYFGGARTDLGNAIAVDVWGNAYATGLSSLPDGSTQQAYVVKIAAGGNRILSRAVFGSGSSQAGTAIAVDPLGYAVVAGNTSSATFPVTSGVRQPVYGGAQDAFVLRTPTFTKLDFNGDATPDLLFQNTSDGRLVNWLMQGDQETSFNFLSPSNPGTNWNVAASADMNGDNSTDLLFQNSSSGDLAYWFMNGANETSFGYLSPSNPGANWKVVGMADFNRDGFPDVLFQNSSSGDLFVWYMRGTTMISGSYLTPRNPGANWNVAAVGDLNNDGQADIVFQNSSTGNVYVWYMHASAMVTGGFTVPANPGTGWNVAGLTDINGDGRPEILFQNKNSGQLAYWVMSGLNVNSIGLPNPSNPGAVWKLVGSK